MTSLESWWDHLSWAWALGILFFCVALTCIACVVEARRIPRERLPKPDPKVYRDVFRGDWK